MAVTLLPVSAADNNHNVSAKPTNHRVTISVFTYGNALAVALSLLVVFLPTRIQAAEAIIAVATNFALPAQTLAERYEEKSGHKLSLATGSSGLLFAQSANGAPYDVFLSADENRAEALVARGVGVERSFFVYALGSLMLISADESFAGQSIEDVLRGARRIAIANPKVAPYGVAAKETLSALGLWDSVQQRLVIGENVAQAQVMVDTGNAQVGIVAAVGHVTSNDRGGVRWHIPDRLYLRIRQAAVLTRRGQNNEAAVGFLDFLRSDDGGEIVQSFGYGRLP